MIRREEQIPPAVRDPAPLPPGTEEDYLGFPRPAGEVHPPDVSGSLPCPFCGYDIHVQVAQDAAASKRSSRCSECGEIVQHQQIVDNIPLLCERRTPLLAFFLLPIDLFRLLLPRFHLARYAPLTGPRPRASRLIFIGLPLWVLSAALWFIFVALLDCVTAVSGCEPERNNPFTGEALLEVGNYVFTHHDVPYCIALVSSGFAVAALVLMLTIGHLRPAGELGQVQFMRGHAARRALYAFSLVFWGFLLGGGLALLIMWSQVDEEINFLTPKVCFPLSCVLALVLIPWFLIRLARMGYADGGAVGAWVYVGCGGLAVGAWFLWVCVLGGLLMHRNLAQILEELYLW